MKLAGVNPWIIGAVVATCAAPAAALNIWPRIEAAMLKGAITSGEIGILVLVTVSALGMTAIPFAMKKADNWGFWTICLAFGLALGSLNYAMAVGAIGKVRDASTGEILSLQAKQSQIKRQIEAQLASRSGLPPFRYTSDAMVQAAAQAVTLAQEAVQQECTVVKDHCRARQAQLFNRTSELASVSRDRALTEQQHVIDRDIRQLHLELAGLGFVPRTVDPQAERIAKVVAKFYDLGDTPGETVADGLISVLAIIAEAFALGMPRIIVTAIGEYQAREKTHLFPVLKRTLIDVLERRVEARRNLISAAAAPAAGLKTIEVFEPKATPSSGAPRTSPIQSPKPKPTKLLTSGEVAEWKQANLIPRPGVTLACWTAYTAYKGWCSARQRAEAPYQQFLNELEASGVRQTKIGTKPFLVDVAVVTQLKVVA